MKKPINKQINRKTAICLFGAILLLSGCPGPMTGDAETATININLGGGGGRAAVDPATLADLSYVAVLTGPSTIKVGPTAPGTQTLSISVAPGRWNITVTAYLDGKVYAEGSSSVEVQSGQSSAVAIKLQQVIFTITYDLNGGPGTIPAAQTGALGTSVTIADGSGFSGNGFTFKGWNTKADSTGTDYSAGYTFTLSANITLYAKWNTFNSITDFQTWLSSQTANPPPAAPYTVKLNISNAVDFADLKTTLLNNSSKFFTLDLSTSVDLPDRRNSSEEIFYEAFGGPSSGVCLNLVGIIFPAHITESGFNAFWGCSNLTSVTMPGVTEIRSGCFTNCTSLTSVTIPAGVNKIGNNAFAGCNSLTTVVFLSDGILIEPGSGATTFPGNLATFYSGAGTYTRAPNGTTWTKQ